MPKGDRYIIDPYTKGPKRTLAPLNSDVKILQDVADRVADLEEEEGSAGGGTYLTFDFSDAGVPKLIDIDAKNIRSA